MSKSFTLIVCTYMRPKALLKLLKSVATQTLYPNEILIIDGSSNKETEFVLSANSYHNLKYYRVDEDNRGLTKQRNYGINLVDHTSEIICFLDDDIELSSTYFENLIGTYNTHPEALAVGGYISNEVAWQPADNVNASAKFYYDGWMRNESSRYRWRKFFGLAPDVAPGFMPTFSHGRPVSFLPPSGKVYEIEQLMGGASSYKKEVFQKLCFSTYFEGYGLYEDADFSLRLAKLGKIYLNTNAKLAHYHEASGRPNQYEYGKMVVRNGWYVWRVKYSNPNLEARLKWNLNVILLAKFRMLNTITTSKRQEAFTESLGRTVGWLSLIFNKPKVK